MPNNIQESGADAVALQITKPARAAELVEVDSDGDPTYRAAVRVYAFDDVLLVVDRDRVDPAAVAELVATVARDTASIYQAVDAGVHVAGHGYKVHLPMAADAGFDIGDTAPTHPAPNLLTITKRERDGTRLAEDVKTIRLDQVHNFGG